MALSPTALRAVSQTHRDDASVRLSRRAVTFWILVALYVALTISVLVPSPVLSLDQYLAALHLKQNHPGYKPWINTYVIFGQRGPATLAFLPLFLWMAWRRRSMRPLLMLGTALVLLNVSVGVAKYAIGRIGPWHLPDNAVHRIFDGGNIYPSGHVSNAVVLYGLVAWILPARYRKITISIAALLSVTVGLGTVYLRTHWFSDVVGGWLAGSLVLLTLPTVMPYVERWTDAALGWLAHRYPRLPWRRTPVVVVEQMVCVQPDVKEEPTPVSSTAQSHSADAVSASRDRLDERTRVG